MEDYGDIYYVDSRNAVSRHYDPRPSAQRRPYVPGGRVPTQTYYVRPEPRFSAALRLACHDANAALAVW